MQVVKLNNHMVTAVDEVNLVWLKRDLRLRDHAPLLEATHSGHPVLLLYVIEPLALEDPHMDIRHWRFIWQSLEDLLTSNWPEFQCPRTRCSRANYRKYWQR